MIFFGAQGLDAALFDLDGTLVQSHIDFAHMRSEMLRLAAEIGVPKDALVDNEILEMVDKAAGLSTLRERDALKQRMWLRLEEIEREGCRGAQPIAGAADLLRRLRGANVGIGIVTRNCRSVSAPLLEGLELPYDVLLTRDDVARCKPNPAHLQDALAALHAAPERAIMVGDHWLDVQAGRQCGCAATLGVLGNRDAAWFNRCRPDVVVLDLSGALPLFRSA